MKLPPVVRNFITKLLTEYFRYLLIGIAFVVLLAGYFFLLQPQIQNVQGQGVGQLKAVEQRLQSRQAYLTKLQGMISKYKEVVGKQSIAPEKIIPNNVDFGPLLLTVDAIVRNSGLSLDSIAITEGQSLATTQGATPSRSNATIQVLDVQITISGNITYEVYKNLIGNFERSLRLFDIPSISFKSAQKADTDASESTAQSTSFELKTYYLGQLAK